MLRIQRVYSTLLPSDQERLRQAQEILCRSFPGEKAYAGKIPDLLNRPFKYGYTTVLLTSEPALGKVNGFSLFLCFPEINSALLDFIVLQKESRGRGLGGALYEATREHLHDRGSRGLYLEALPDDPAVVTDPATLQENRRRLRFYEYYGVRPIIGTEYETPLGDNSPGPHLLFDGLGRDEPLRRAECRAAVRVILKRRYGHLAPADYVERVVESFIDDPVRIREPRYVKEPRTPKPVRPGRLQNAFVVASCPDHNLHHVGDRGYVERPARIEALLEGLGTMALFSPVSLRHFGEKSIRAVHDDGFVRYLKAVCEKLATSRPVYPYVFPVRRPERQPKDLAVRAGYYCIDTFTPLDRNAYRAARGAVDVAMTAATEVLQGRRLAYALCRPPGHHAERRVFGGFCYFNNVAAAAHMLSAHGKVAVLDIDFHHGNGTQDIFYERDDVLTVSIHGHPNHAYPYFSGFADETGSGKGLGLNRNFPLPEGADEKLYLDNLARAVRLIERFHPTFLAVSLGFDTMKGDPTGSFLLTAESLRKAGRLVGALGLPNLVVQEGGYNLRSLRRGVVAFFHGMAEAIS